MQLRKGRIAVEKRRIRLEINGVVCGLITQESEEYMESLAKEVGQLMQSIQEASPYITREAAALTAALSYCDDAGKNGRHASELQERIDELEVEAELWQEEKEEWEKSGKSAAQDSALLEKLQKLEQENTTLTEAAGKAEAWEEKARRLEDENTALREAGAVETPSAVGAELEEKLRKLEEENHTLRTEAERKTDLVKQVQEERESAISAAKRAVEEARRRVDELQKQAEDARWELEQVKKQNASPALDLLEQEVREHERETESTLPRSKRKNPLRYEEDFEGEGFVSFFEKK